MDGQIRLFILPKVVLIGVVSKPIDIYQSILSIRRIQVLRVNSYLNNFDLITWRVIFPGVEIEIWADKEQEICQPVHGRRTREPVLKVFLPVQDL